MTETNCPNEDQYWNSKNGRCCNRCRAGSYMKTECDSRRETECTKCEDGLYTATKNHLNKCHVCTVCSSNNNQKTLKPCTAQEDTVCVCVNGFYCSNEHCDHCRPVSNCDPGQGVKVLATRTNNTICAQCEEGTYSNVTDFHSPCRVHTRCDETGRALKIPGTRTADAICGDFRPQCHWILPACLWSGLVLTTIILFGLFYWREKRKSYRTANTSNVPVTLVEMTPAPPQSPLDLPLPSTELRGYCQESCTKDGCDQPLFKSDYSMCNGNTPNSLDSCQPITPFKASVSFVESDHGNGSTGYRTSNFLRSYSEPQEDEWCGT